MSGRDGEIGSNSGSDSGNNSDSGNSGSDGKSGSDSGNSGSDFGRDSVSDVRDATGSYMAGSSIEGSSSFTETTSQSWFSRIGGALTGLLIGLAMIPGGSGLLFWNEGRAVTTARSLSEGAGLVQDTAPGRIDPAREGRLVHVAGPVTVATPPRDAELFVTPPAAALRLVRRVEMYQWKEEQQSETRNRLGGGTETVTTYRYNRVWDTGRIDSSRFRQPGGHDNPSPRYAAQAWSAQGARLGAFALSDAQLSLLPADQPFGETRYIGVDANTPRIGDLRVSWRIAQPEAVSVVAAQTSDGFGPYATRAGDRLMMVQPGRVPASAMFQQAGDDNAVLTWVLRAVGTIVVFLGFWMFFNPLKVLADVVPFVGSIVGFGTSLLAGVLTLVVAPAVIAVAWLAYRPLIGIAILLVGFAAAFGISRLRRPRAAVPRPA